MGQGRRREEEEEEEEGKGGGVHSPGSAAQARKVTTSLACCDSVAGVPAPPPRPPLLRAERMTLAAAAADLLLQGGYQDPQSAVLPLPPAGSDAACPLGPACRGRDGGRSCTGRTFSRSFRRISSSSGPGAHRRHTQPPHRSASWASQWRRPVGKRRRHPFRCGQR